VRVTTQKGAAGVPGTKKSKTGNVSKKKRGDQNEKRKSLKSRVKCKLLRADVLTEAGRKTVSRPIATKRTMGKKKARLRNAGTEKNRRERGATNSEGERGRLGDREKKKHNSEQDENEGSRGQRGCCCTKEAKTTWPIGSRDPKRLRPSGKSSGRRIRLKARFATVKTGVSPPSSRKWGAKRKKTARKGQKEKGRSAPRC